MDDTAFRTFVDEVKRRTDLVALIGKDIPLTPSGSVFKGRCPKNRDSDPSLVVWPDSQRWRDYSGGGMGGGDCFDYLDHARGMAFREALQLLAGEASVALPGLSADQAKAQTQRVVERRRIESLLTEAAGYYHRVLPTKIRRELYGRHYGFTDATIDQLQLGWGGGNLLEHLTGTFGASEDEALSTGLFVKAGNETYELFRFRLVFPYWDHGRMVYFIAHKTHVTPDDPWEQAKYKKLLTHSSKHRYVSPLVQNETFYNEDAARTADELLVTEGVTDCISAMRAGIVCTSPVTVRFRKQDHDKLLALTAQSGRIVICNDAEQSGAGEAGALETARVLHQAGRDVRLAALPSPEGVEVNVNELVKASGTEALRAVLDSAKRLPEYLLGNVPADTKPAELGQALEPVLGVVTQRPPLERDALVAAIAKRFDLKLRSVQELLKAARRAEAGSRSSSVTAERPVISMGSQPRDMAAQAWQAIHASNDPPRLFARSGMLVRILRDETGTRIDTLDEAAVLDVLAEAADWVSETDEGVRNVFPPGNVTRVVHSRPRGLAVLQAILTVPTVASNGTLLTRAGYHAEAHAWLELADGFTLPAVSEVPSDVEVAAARSLFLDDLLIDFPFVETSDQAHMMALLLLPFARRLVGGVTPLHMVEAPASGSGKGLLVALVGVLATGEPASGGSIPTVTRS